MWLCRYGYCDWWLEEAVTLTARGDDSDNLARGVVANGHRLTKPKTINRSTRNIFIQPYSYVFYTPRVVIAAFSRASKPHSYISAGSETSWARFWKLIAALSRFSKPLAAQNFVSGVPTRTSFVCTWGCAAARRFLPLDHWVSASLYVLIVLSFGGVGFVRLL